jgi:hypothetical protein
MDPDLFFIFEVPRDIQGGLAATTCSLEPELAM